MSNIQALCHAVAEKKIFSCISIIHKSMVDNDMPGAWPVWIPGAQLAGFIKRTTIHCYTLHTKYESSGPCGFGDFFVFVPLKVYGR